MSAAPIPPAGRYDALAPGAGPAGRWPNGAALAVYVAVGVEHYRFGDGHTEDLLPGAPAPDMVNAAWRDYGNNAGAFRLLERLSELGIPPALLLNTAVYDAAPAVTDAARRAGAEVVGHGVSNSDSLAGMTPEEEREYVARVADRIAREEGAPPGGWSSPWLAHTPRTIDALAEAGYRYLLDLRFDDRPRWLRTRGAPLLAIPYALELNDSTSMVGRGVAPADFAAMVVDEFDEMRGTAGDEPVVMSLVLHSYVSGTPFRLRALTAALRHIASHAGEVWLAQPRGIHEAFARILPAPGPAEGA